MNEATNEYLIRGLTKDFGDVSDSRHMCDKSLLVCHESCHTYQRVMSHI